jgi:hypothetical protein
VGKGTEFHIEIPCAIPQNKTEPLEMTKPLEPALEVA